VQSPANTEFLNMWRAFIRNPRRVTNDPMEATYTGFKMWTQAVTQAGTTAVDAVREAMYGQKVDAPAGYTEEMHRNHHLSKPVMIGEIQADGQFNIVWKTPTAIVAENWSPFIPENAARRRG
jgi:urea transport system substrate-binding protein